MFWAGISESDSDDYSPVCSEVDPTDFPLPSTAEDEESLNPDLDKNSDVPSEAELPGFDTTSSTTKQGVVKLVMEIVDLLKTYVKLKPPLPQLGTPELLLRLVKCSDFFDWPHSSAIFDIMDVIYKILESHDYLVPLMQTDFLPAIYYVSKLPQASWCQKCRQFLCIGSSILKKMAKVAESGMGKGNIAHKLLRGDNAMKEQMALAIPYVVRNKAILLKLMLNCGALEVLLKLLQEKSPLQNKSIKSLCVLSRKFVPNPKKLSTTLKKSLAKSSHSDTTTVTFKLDDGRSLSAEREALGKSSEYFARLLNGDFKESTQEVIALSNVNSQSLEFLLRLIKCEVDTTLPVYIDVELDTFLDVVSLCDRFLMEDYRVFLTDCIEKHRMNSFTIPSIYNWSLQSRTNLLRLECIVYALGANIADSDRVEMFKSLFDLGFTEELLDDIKKLLVKHMTLGRIV
jgi:hypothetical protein